MCLIYDYSEGVCMPQQMCGIQMTALGVGPCLPLCLWQDFLFSSTYASLSGLQVSVGSLVCTFPFDCRNAGMTDVSHQICLHVVSAFPNPFIY